MNDFVIEQELIGRQVKEIKQEKSREKKGISRIIDVSLL